MHDEHKEDSRQPAGTVPACLDTGAGEVPKHSVQEVYVVPADIFVVSPLLKHAFRPTITMVVDKASRAVISFGIGFPSEQHCDACSSGERP